MTLAELGAQLREERINLGLSVEDVASRLKVPARILRAIEDGDVNELPHTVYTRGFIKGYGLLVGYSSDSMTEFVDSLEEFTEDFSPPKAPETQKKSEMTPLGCKRQSFGLVLKLLLLALICSGGYAYYTHTYRDAGQPLLDSAQQPSQEAAQGQKQGSAQKTDQTASQVAPVPQAADSSFSSSGTPSAGSPSSGLVADPNAPGQSSSELSANAVPSASPVPSASSVSEGDKLAPAGTAANSVAALIPSAPTSSAASASSGAGQAALAPANGNTQPTEADPVKPRGLEALPATAVPTPPVSPKDASSAAQSSLPAGMHQIVLTASAECWVHANADGTDTREFSLKTGETFAMPFKKSMVLKLGNAGGVTISYDGVDLPPPGKPGQVKTITLPPKE